MGMESARSSPFPWKYATTFLPSKKRNVALEVLTRLSGYAGSRPCGGAGKIIAVCEQLPATATARTQRPPTARPQRRLLTLCHRHPRELPLADLQQMNARRSEEHTSELQSPCNLVCRRLL